MTTAGSVILLSALPRGASARVVRLNLQGPDRRRLLDLGFVPGTLVTRHLTSPLGDPTAYRVRGATTSLRRAQSDMVEVTPCAAGGPAHEGG